MIHVLNYRSTGTCGPTCFEASPAHLVNAVHEAIEGLRAALGSTTLLQYTLQVPGGPKAYETACFVGCVWLCACLLSSKLPIYVYHEYFE